MEERGKSTPEWPSTAGMTMITTTATTTTTTTTTTTITTTTKTTATSKTYYHLPSHVTMRMDHYAGNPYFAFFSSSNYVRITLPSY